METINEKLIDLLHEGECPFDYKCRETDCLACLQSYTDETKSAAENDDQ